MGSTTMMKRQKITVLLAEDHLLVREGLHKLLESEEDIEVAGQTSPATPSERVPSRAVSRSPWSKTVNYCSERQPEITPWLH